MQYKKIIFVLLFFCSSFWAMAQDCRTYIDNPDPTQNPPWWYEKTWLINSYWGGISGTTTNIQEKWTSPFYADGAGTSNIYKIGDEINGKKDFLYEDGWRCIKRHIGTSLSEPVPYPYFIFYNIYTAKMRIFLLRTQKYGESGQGTDKDIKTSYFKVFLRSGNEKQDNDNSRFRPGILTELSNPTSETLSEDSREIVINMPQVDENVLPFWYLAEIPLSYDPCVCREPGRNRKPIIEFELWENDSEKVDLCSSASGECSPISSPQTANSNTPFSTIEGVANSIGKNASSIENGISDVKKAINDLPGWIFDGSIYTGGASPASGANSFANFTQKKLIRIANAKEGLSKLAQQAGTLAGKIAKVASAVSMVSAGIDVFISLMKTFSGASDDSGVMGFQSYRTTGTISSSKKIASGSFQVPGSGEAEREYLATIYNNPTGILNVLSMPEIISNHNYPFTFISIPRHSSTTFGDIKHQNYNFLHYEIVKKPEIVVNPALKIDMANSDISVSYEFEDDLKIPLEQGKLKALNIDFDMWENRVTSGTDDCFKLAPQPDNSLFCSESFFTSKSIPKYRTPFFALGCVEGQTMSFYSMPISVLKWSGDYGTNKWRVRYTEPGLIYMKVKARLRRTDTNNPKDDIIYVNRYKVTFGNEQINQAKLGNNQGIIDLNIQRPINITYPDVGYYGNTLEASENLTILGYDIPNDLKNFYAGQSVTISPRKLYDNEGVGSVTFLPGTNIGINESFDFSSRAVCNVPIPVQGQERIFEFCRGSQYEENHNLANRQYIDSQASTSDLINDLKVYPNPATGTSVDMTYSLSEKATANLHIYNAKGEKVGVLVNESKDAGKYDITWDINQIPNGLYFCTLEINGKRIVKRLIIQK